MTKGEAIANIIWFVVSFVLFVIVSCLTVSKAVKGEAIDYSTTMGIGGTGLTCISILQEIYVELPEYIEVLRKR